MTVEEKTKLFKRFLKELGFCKIYIQDNKMCKRKSLRKTIEYINSNYKESDYNTPSEVINQSLFWAATGHEYLWSALYDYMELEVNNWNYLNENIERIVNKIKKYLEGRDDLGF